jgi:hypothetical protein
MLEWIKAMFMSLSQPKAGVIETKNITHEELKGLTKLELEELGIQLFDIDIDRRKKHSSLVAKLWKKIKKIK